MTKPPETLHELLALALADYDIISQRPGYVIDMMSWHAPKDKERTCHVCLAGCVIARTLQYDKDICAIPDDFDENWAEALEYLDDLRLGIIPLIWKRFPVRQHPNPNWRSDMQHLLEYLQLRGL